MPPAQWFWGLFALTVLGCFFAGWGAAPPRSWLWSWSVPFVLILCMLALLAMSVFGKPVQG